MHKNLSCFKVYISILLLFFANGVIQAQTDHLQTYINKEAKEIDSTGKSFAGLSFLDTLLKDKRIVILGESSHGTEEYSEVKLKLIEYLHSKLGFNVVLFESPMMPGSYFNLAPVSASPDSLVVNSIQYIWHTKTVNRLFTYLKNNGMNFSGIDPQFKPSPFSIAFLQETLKEYLDLQKAFIKLEQEVTESFSKENDYLDQRGYFSRSYYTLASRVNELPSSPTLRWLHHMALINARYYARLQQGNERDSCMATNLAWLADSFYAGEKIIVWAHNSHIDKNSTSSVRFMGKLAAEHFKNNLFAIGLYMIGGQTALNNRKVIDVKKAGPGSLESLIKSTGFNTAFISTNHPAFDKRIETFHWGKDRQRLNLSKSYDAVIVVRESHSPLYLLE